MSFFSNARETSGRYGKYIAEFQELFRRHEMAFGSPEDFFQLAPKLSYDDGFRREFAVLTKSVAQQAEGRLTLTRILTIVAIAMGGEGIEDLGSASAVPISLVVVFLAGVGGWSETEPASEPETAEVVGAASVGAETESRREAPAMTATDDELEALELERRLSMGPVELEGLTASPGGGPAIVQEALSRLEINTLALKLHLDSIDSRMGRIEPHLDDLTARLNVPAADGHVGTHAVTNGEAKVPLPVRRYSQPETAVPPVPRTAPDMPHAAAVLPVADPSSQVRRLYGVVTAMGILLFVLAGAVVALLYTDRGRRLRDEEEGRFALTHAAGQNIADKTSGPERSSGTDPPGALAAREAAQPEVSKTLLLRPAGATRVPENKVQEKETTVEPATVVQGNTPGKIHISKAAEPPAGISVANVHMSGGLPGPIQLGGSRPMPKVFSANALAATGISSPGAPTSGAGRVVFVPAVNLEGSAILSPKPVYPPRARSMHVEGDVVVQVAISETGAIKSATATKGPLALRDAAVTAMRGWKYKPYLVNGKPIEVHTYVDFRFEIDR
jgi:TonB family protein